MVGNKILIEGGAGILTIAEDKIQAFNENLNRYYKDKLWHEDF